MTADRNVVSTTSGPDGPEVVLLFDIDGTLLDARGAGRRALESAVVEWSGRSLGSFHVHLGGRTDLDILRELVGVLGRPYPSPPERRAVLRRYLQILDEELLSTPPRVLPGVRELLRAVAGRIPQHHPNAVGVRFHSGLVTGNVLPGARRKLTAAGLVEYFDFRFGAFGNDHEDRNRLVPVALRRSQGGRSPSPGPPVDPGRAVVIGDTQNDIDCARAAGSAVVIVGTGFGDFESLAPQADAAFADLSDTGKVVTSLIGLAAGPR